MANLNTKTIADGVGDILAVDGGLHASTERAIKDGDGTSSPLKITTAKLVIDGKLVLGDASELTISSGAITVTGCFHSVDTESDAGTDDLATINGGEEGQILVLTANNAARSVVVKDGTGNIKSAGDFTLDNSEDTIALIYTGSAWLELTRSNNGA